jgi:hypothetical protein
MRIEAGFPPQADKFLRRTSSSPQSQPAETDELICESTMTITFIDTNNKLKIKIEVLVSDHRSPLSSDADGE